MNATQPTTIDSTLHVGWPLPWWLVIVTLLAAAGFAAGLYLTERGEAPRWLRAMLAGLRCCLLAMVLWMLTGWSWLRVRTELPELVIAVDVSDSMQTPDGEQGPSKLPNLTRLERAQQLLSLSGDQLRWLSQRYQLKCYAIAADAVPARPDLDHLQLFGWSAGQPVELDTSHSRLGEALARVIDRQAGRGTAAIVFVSDGVVTAGMTLAEAGGRARRAAIPIHAIAVGQQQARPDLRLGDLLAESQVYLGDRVTIEVHLTASNVPDSTVAVQLTDLATGRLLDEQSVMIGSLEPSRSVTLSFVPDQAGSMPLQVAVDSLPNEVNTDNNRLDLNLLVQDRLIRVLLVFARPTYEFRFLKHFLERSTHGDSGTTAAFQLTSILQDGDLDYVRQDISAARFVPSDSQALAEFDAFVFGPFDPSLIPRSSQQAIVQAVTSGGAGCIFLAGDENPLDQLAGWPLELLLPVESASGLVRSDEGFRIVSTRLGQSALPLQWNSATADRSSAQALPPLESILPVQVIKPGAQILAEAVSLGSQSRSPWLISQFAGGGRTALLATDETYRWTGVYGSDRYHQLYWGQMLRWLSRGRLAGRAESELSVDPKQAPLGVPIRFRLQLPAGGDLPEQAEIRIQDATGGQRSATLPRLAGGAAQYQTMVDQLPGGNYRAVVVAPPLGAPPTVEFNVVAPPSEQANLRSDFESLQRLAELSRGRAYTADQAADWLEELPAGRAARLGSLPPRPIWNQHWVALLFVGLITAEWLLRRHARML